MLFSVHKYLHLLNSALTDVFCSMQPVRNMFSIWKTYFLWVSPEKEGVLGTEILIIKGNYVSAFRRYTGIFCTWWLCVEMLKCFFFVLLAFQEMMTILELEATEPSAHHVAIHWPSYTAGHCISWWHFELCGFQLLPFPLWIFHLQFVWGCLTQHFS